MWYKLTNNSCGPDIPLDIVNDAGRNSSGELKMAAWAPRGHTGQHWQFRPHEDNDGTYKLCTRFLGTSKSLDVYGDDKSQPHLADEGNYSGQKWKIVPWFRCGTWDGTYKLWNTHSGDSMFLDTSSGSRRPYMGEGDHTGKHWTIKPIRPITVEEHLIS
jgi:immune inhibitor A